MKKLKIFVTALIPAFFLASCQHQTKDEQIIPETVAEAKKSTDDISKEVYTDDFGDQLEVAFNKSQNTVVVHFDGKSYELKKNEELPEFTAGDAYYQYSDVRGEVTLLKKDYNMVLFHHKKNKTSAKGTPMASY